MSRLSFAPGVSCNITTLTLPDTVILMEVLCNRCWSLNRRAIVDNARSNTTDNLYFIFPWFVYIRQPVCGSSSDKGGSVGSECVVIVVVVMMLVVVVLLVAVVLAEAEALVVVAVAAVVMVALVVVASGEAMVALMVVQAVTAALVVMAWHQVADHCCIRCYLHQVSSQSISVP